MDNAIKEKKIKLKLKPDFNFEIIAIATTKDDYSISWEINKALNIDLIKCKDFKYIDDKQNKTKNFALFSYYDESDRTNYNLMGNKSDEGTLLKDFINFNFFLKIESENEHFALQETIDKIKNIKEVSAVSNIQYGLLSESRKKSIFGLFTNI